MSSLIFGICLTLTSSSKAMFLTKIEPYIVLLLGILAHNVRITRAHALLLIFHICGAVILSTGGHFTLSAAITGDLLILVGVCIQALLYAPTQRYVVSMGALTTSAYSQLIGSIVLLPLPFLLASSDLTIAGEAGIGWLYALGTVLSFYVISTTLWFYSLKELPAWLASAMRCIGPVVAAPLAYLFFDTRLSLLQVAGALVVIATSMWMIVLEHREKHQASTC